MMQFIDLFKWVKRPGLAWRGKSHEINAFCGELNIVLTYFSFRSRMLDSIYDSYNLFKFIIWEPW